MELDSLIKMALLINIIIALFKNLKEIKNFLERIKKWMRRKITKKIIDSCWAAAQGLLQVSRFSVKAVYEAGILADALYALGEKGKVDEIVGRLYAEVAWRVCRENSWRFYAGLLRLAAYHKDLKESIMREECLKKLGRMLRLLERDNELAYLEVAVATLRHPDIAGRLSIDPDTIKRRTLRYLDSRAPLRYKAIYLEVTGDTKFIGRLKKHLLWRCWQGRKRNPTNAWP